MVTQLPDTRLKRMAPHSCFVHSFDLPAIVIYLSLDIWTMKNSKTSGLVLVFFDSHDLSINQPNMHVTGLVIA